jgi:DNA invertase Pin-like site-specific DNA recombinase
LMEAGVDFEAVDFPQANRLTIHILAAVAEHEAKLISERTRAALRAAKDRGVVLGGFRGRSGSKDDCEKARAMRTRAATQRAIDLLPTIERLRRGGGVTLAKVAAELNKAQIPTARRGCWSAAQVRRVLARGRQAVKDQPV